MKNEEWRDVVGYEGRYQVSSMGRVKSLERKDRFGRTVKERILKSYINRYGYLLVALCAGGKQKTLNVHRLVCEAFLPRAEGKDAINHKDEDKTNNNVWNLEWVSHKENCNFGTRNERIAKALSKPVAQYTKDVAFIKAWASAAEVKRQLGFNHSNIIQVAKGNRKTACGYIWKYV